MTSHAPSNALSIADGKAQVNKMKIELGEAKYKQLKKLTKSFAADKLDPESYVSSTLSLFEKGIKDPIFCKTLPNLIDTCPNESNSKRATRYLDSICYLLLQMGMNHGSS